MTDSLPHTNVAPRMTPWHCPLRVRMAFRNMNSVRSADVFDMYESIAGFLFGTDMVFTPLDRDHLPPSHDGSLSLPWVREHLLDGPPVCPPTSTPVDSTTQFRSGTFECYHRNFSVRVFVQWQFGDPVAERSLLYSRFDLSVTFGSPELIPNSADFAVAKFALVEAAEKLGDLLSVAVLSEAANSANLVVGRRVAWKIGHLNWAKRYRHPLPGILEPSLEEFGRGVFVVFDEPSMTRFEGVSSQELDCIALELEPLSQLRSQVNATA